MRAAREDDNDGGRAMDETIELGCGCVCICLRVCVCVCVWCVDLAY